MSEFPLRAFLLHLQADGISVRVADYRRIARALQGEGRWTRRRLRDTLATLLAKDPEQEQCLQRHFARFFHLDAAEQESDGEIDTAAFIADLRALAEAADKPVAPARCEAAPKASLRLAPKRKTAAMHAILLTLLAASIALALWFHWPRPETPKTVRPVTAQKTNSDSVEPSTRLFRDVPYIKEIRYTPVEKASKGQAYLWPAISLGLLLLAYLAYLYRAQKVRFPEPPPWDDSKPLRFSLAGLGGPPAPLLDRRTLDEAADAISYFRSDKPAPTLDINATLKATMGQGGLPALRFQRRKQIRSLLILRDRRSRTAWNHGAEELAAGIARRGVPVLYGRFQGAPWRFQTQHGGDYYLEDLEDRRAAFMVLIFSDARRCQEHPIWTDLARWPYCAWLDYREARHWDAAHPARRYGLPLYQADAEGVQAALHGFLNEQRQHRPDPPDAAPTWVADHPASLAACLGDALPWAQDCALLQPLSLGLAEQLRRRYPRLPATRLQRLLDLPGSRYHAEGIQFSASVSRWLQQGFEEQRGAKEQQAVLALLRQALLQARPADSRSPAFLDWQSRLALLKLRGGETAPELAALAQTPLRAALSGRLREAYWPKLEERGQQILAALPDSPWAAARRRFYPCNSTQKALLALLCGLPLLLLIFGWDKQSPVQKESWHVSGGDSPATLWQPQSGAAWRGSLSELSQSIRLQAETDYRLMLHGDGYWQEIALRPPKGEQAELILATRDVEQAIWREPQTGMEFVKIPGGCFDMGSPETEQGRYDDELQHRVCLDSFWLGRTEVTQAQWEKIMGDNPARFKGADRPVETVFWEDAQTFIDKLSAQSGQDFRLPSEAEWEYAARAGTDTPFYTGQCLSTEQANYDGNYPTTGCPKGEYRGETLPVASFAPNNFGLYDMHGNVLEWVQDWYGDYPSARRDNPEGPRSGGSRVVRGGSWGDDARGVRAAYRSLRPPDYRFYFLGFRCVRVQHEPGQAPLVR